MKEVSLGKAQTRIKTGVKQLQSVQGLKRTAVHFGLGFAVGTIVDLILQYIWIHFVNPTIGYYRLEGFTIFPTHIDPTTGTPYMNYDDVLLLVVTVIMLFSKKLWFVVGFFGGWYLSSYLGLYGALGLPEPTSQPTT